MNIVLKGPLFIIFTDFPVNRFVGYEFAGAGKTAGFTRTDTLRRNSGWNS